MPKKIPKKAAHPLKVNEEEAPICQQLLEKHGENYEMLDAMGEGVVLSCFSVCLCQRGGGFEWVDFLLVFVYESFMRYSWAAVRGWVGVWWSLVDV